MFNVLKKNFFVSLCCIVITMSLSSCIYIVVGTVGALGGYMISPDTVEGITANDKDSLWDAAVNVVSIMGIIEEQEKSSGIMIAKVSGTKVTITITPLNQSTVKLSVKARKSYLPKSQVAQDIFVKIMSQVNE
jgi:hypothetical protein